MFYFFGLIFLMVFLSDFSTSWAELFLSSLFYGNIVFYLCFLHSSGNLQERGSRTCKATKCFFRTIRTWQMCRIAAMYIFRTVLYSMEHVFIDCYVESLSFFFEDWHFFTLSLICGSPFLKIFGPQKKNCFWLLQLWWIWTKQVLLSIFCGFLVFWVVSYWKDRK